MPVILNDCARVTLVMMMGIRRHPTLDYAANLLNQCKNPGRAHSSFTKPVKGPNSGLDIIYEQDVSHYSAKSDGRLYSALAALVDQPVFEAAVDPVDRSGKVRPWANGFPRTNPNLDLDKQRAVDILQQGQSSLLTALNTVLDPSERDLALYRDRVYAPPKDQPTGKLGRLLDIIHGDSRGRLQLLSWTEPHAISNRRIRSTIQ
ncbi:hypothetical protein HD554DRAFT_2329757 [Boletus coccyginus]|nr:hypothetical protein HD554DRAFT_2329757 [Boletus coccyginus]